MKIKYHGYNCIDLERGDLIRYQTVVGHWYAGTFIDVLPPRPHRTNLTYIRVLIPTGVADLNTAMIFRMEKP